MTIDIDTKLVKDFRKDFDSIIDLIERRILDGSHKTKSLRALSEASRNISSALFEGEIITESE